MERLVRQHLLTDYLLGLDFVPLTAADTPSVPPQASADRSSISWPAEGSPHLPSKSAPTFVSAAVPSASGTLFSAVESSRPACPRFDRATKIAILEELDRTQVRSCTRCDLCRSRSQTVFGEGDVDAQLMFIGEGPGETEDRLGRPFVGRAGELLDRMIAAMGFQRSQVYIANTVKCRPPANRTPLPAEIETCWPYLREQIRVVQPRVIVALGGPAAKTLLDTSAGITTLRGTWHWMTRLADVGLIIPVMPTFHPAYLLRAYTLENRKKVWDDLQKVLAYLKGQLQLTPPVL